MALFKVGPQLLPPFSVNPLFPPKRKSPLPLSPLASLPVVSARNDANLTFNLPVTNAPTKECSAFFCFCHSEFTRQTGIIRSQLCTWIECTLFITHSVLSPLFTKYCFHITMIAHRLGLNFNKINLLH